LAQRFGPINQENGWRRLNVLITRAKQKMHVFTSMLSTDIRITDSSSRGVKALANFLKFLEHSERKQLLSREPERFSNLFSEIVYEILTAKGYKVVPRVGVSGYYIDLAVCSKKDGSYILAIECDGEEYLSANSTSDRERLKVEALKRLGWNHYRVWSMEWHKNRTLELERLLEKIETCEENRFKLEAKAVETLETEENREEEERYSLDLEKLNAVDDKLSFDNSEALYVENKLSIELLPKCTKLKLLIMPLTTVKSHLNIITLPKIKTLIIKINKPRFHSEKVNEFPLELMYELLLKQPSIKTFAVKYYDFMHKFRYLSLLGHLFKEVPNLKRIHLFHQSVDNELFEDYITIEPSKREPLGFIATEFKDSSSLTDYDLPFILQECTTLRSLYLPYLNSPKTIEYLLDKNREIQNFTCSRKVVSSNILEMNFENFKMEEEKAYREDFNIVIEELQEINDPLKKELIHHFLLDEPLTYAPHKATILKLLESKISIIRKNALEAFDTYHNDTINSLENLNIFIGTKAYFYDMESVKYQLSKVNSKLNATLNTRTNLLVLGSNNKIKKEIPSEIPMISVMHFEALLKEIQKDITLYKDDLAMLKFGKYLKKIDKSKINQEEEVLSPPVLATLLALFKIHKELEVRKSVLSFIKLHGGEIGTQVLKICEKRQYRSMRNEKNLKKDFNKMSKIEGFDLHSFAKYIAEHHPFALGSYLFLEDDTDEVEKFILKHLNIDEVRLITVVTPRFLKATKIKTLTVSASSDSLWKMSWLQNLTIESVGKSISLSLKLHHLTALKSLTLYAKRITINCNAIETVETLSVQGCSQLIFEKNTVFEKVTVLNFRSINDDFGMDFSSLRRAFPNLKTIYGEKHVYTIKRFENEIVKEMPHLEFIYKSFY